MMHGQKNIKSTLLN